MKEQLLARLEKLRLEEASAAGAGNAKALAEVRGAIQATEWLFKNWLPQ